MGETKSTFRAQPKGKCVITTGLGSVAEDKDGVTLKECDALCATHAEKKNRRCESNTTSNGGFDFEIRKYPRGTCHITGGNNAVIDEKSSITIKACSDLCEQYQGTDDRECVSDTTANGGTRSILHGHLEGKCIITEGLGVVLKEDDGVTLNDCEAFCASYADKKNRRCESNTASNGGVDLEIRKHPTGTCHITEGSKVNVEIKSDVTVKECDDLCKKYADRPSRE